MNPLDTIAAIATPPGTGGLAVIRISGRDALLVADKLFAPGRSGAPTPSSCPSHTVHHGHVTRAGHAIDEVLLTVLRAPRTYTREDTVEIGCHGGPVITREVLRAALESGARLAEPGEFTRRAFLNGRIDLAQAEAVADLIHARTEQAAGAANAQLAGHLSRRIAELRDQVMLVLAHVEAHIDFPDEDIQPETGVALRARLITAADGCRQLIATAREGRLLRSGARAVIVGPPNAGKSSLLNRLLGIDRAIVSPIAGTTRDTIEEAANIGGIPVVFVDTAGLRHSDDVVEAEGIRRSTEAAAIADVILDLADLSAPPPPPTTLLPSSAPRILVGNKSDLPEHQGHEPARLRISCASGAGLELLRSRIAAALLNGGTTFESAGIAINERHQDALRRALDSLGRTLQAMEEGRPLDLAAVDLRIAAGAVGEVVGGTGTEDLLDRIFSTFCLGK